jgi:hypothetical protein
MKLTVFTLLSFSLLFGTPVLAMNKATALSQVRPHAVTMSVYMDTSRVASEFSKF